VTSPKYIVINSSGIPITGKSNSALKPYLLKVPSPPITTKASIPAFTRWSYAFSTFRF
jgi:hypothetical protein